MNHLKTDPAFRRGWQVVDLRPPRRERPLRETAELDAGPFEMPLLDLPLEADADRWERPRRVDLAEPLAPERPSDDEEPGPPPFPEGAPWEVTPEHAARWRLHNFEHRRGDTNHFRSLGDLSDSEFALLLWDLSCWKGMVRRASIGLGATPPPLEEYLRPGREHWGAIGVLVREWYDLLEAPGG